MDMTEQLTAFWPIILMVVIFYFLLWRPQKKQQKRRQEMLDSLKPGAKIVTVGGVMVPSCLCTTITSLSA